MKPTAPLLLLLLALAFAACGGSDKEVHGVDTSDPKEVVDAAVRAIYDCGERGAGVLHDLSLSSQLRSSREAAIRAQQRRGCRPERVPDYDLLLQGQQGDRRSYEVSMPQDEGGRIVVANTPDGWRMDIEQSELSR